MTTRASLNEHIERAEQALEIANEQLQEWKKQEHYNFEEYQQAQALLEDTHNNLEQVMLSANAQQKERLRRMLIQIRQVQNDMILDQVDLQEHSYIE